MVRGDLLGVTDEPPATEYLAQRRRVERRIDHQPARDRDLVDDRHDFGKRIMAVGENGANVDASRGRLVEAVHPGGPLFLFPIPTPRRTGSRDLPVDRREHNGDRHRGYLRRVAKGRHPSHRLSPFPLPQTPKCRMQRREPVDDPGVGGNDIGDERVGVEPPRRCGGADIAAFTFLRFSTLLSILHQSGPLPKATPSRPSSPDGKAWSLMVVKGRPGGNRPVREVG